MYQITEIDFTHQEAVKSTTTNLVPAAFISNAYCESSPKTRTAIIFLSQINKIGNESFNSCVDVGENAR
jgi:hypothetical protein